MQVAHSARGSADYTWHSSAGSHSLHSQRHPRGMIHYSPACCHATLGAGAAQLPGAVHGISRSGSGPF